jgi:hypothetical protein
MILKIALIAKLAIDVIAAAGFYKNLPMACMFLGYAVAERFG